MAAKFKNAAAQPHWTPDPKALAQKLAWEAQEARRTGERGVH